MQNLHSIIVIQPLTNPIYSDIQLFNTQSIIINIGDPSLVPKLTLKQRKFWKEYCQTHSLIKAAQYAGSKGKDNASLSVCGYDILRSLNLSMPELLEAQGLGTYQLGKLVTEQTQALKPMIATWEGKITDERFYPDNAARGKASELLGRMHGVFIDKHELTGRDGGDIALVVSAPSKGKGKKSISFDD